MPEHSPFGSGARSAGLEELLAQARDQPLGPILRVVALIATFHTAISLAQFLNEGATFACAATLLLLASLWVTALWPMRSERRRSSFALAVMYGAAAFALFTRGLGASGVMAVFGFVVLTALLRGLRMAVYAFALSVLTMTSAALGFHFDTLQVVTPHRLDSRDLLNWLRDGTFGAALLAAVGGVSVSLLRALTLALDERGRLMRELREQVVERERASGALAEAQQRLVHAHRQEALGRLAFGIAHDFNNTLTVILSYTDLLRTRFAADPAGRELSDQIVRAAEQGRDLTKQILTFSRHQDVEPRSIDVQAVLRNIQSSLARLSSSAIRINCVQSREELLVRIDPTQFEQALLNLALNARDAMPDGGDLTLEAKPLDVQADSDLPIEQGRYVVVHVRDTGVGMPSEVLSRAFEPFFTTKEPGLGTGLGLANVRDATEKAGGHVEVASEVGKGTTFSLFLPRAASRVSGVEALAQANSARPGSVLVVDDDPQVRAALRTILGDAGYELHIARDGRHALELAAGKSFALLWADLVMADLSREELLDEFRRLHPRAPVLVCSAFGADDSVSRRAARGELTFLAKPFAPSALVEFVERALGPPLSGGDGTSDERTPRVAG